MTVKILPYFVQRLPIEDGGGYFITAQIGCRPLDLAYGREGLCIVGMVDLAKPLITQKLTILTLGETYKPPIGTPIGDFIGVISPPMPDAPDLYVFKLGVWPTTALDMPAAGNG